MIKRILLATLIISATLPAQERQSTFEAVKGWGVLRWEQKLKEARESLKKTGVPFEEKQMHKDGTTVFLLNREGWEGTVYFDEKNRMTQILFQSPYFKRESEANAAVKKFEKQFGVAQETKNQTYSDGERTDTFYIWKNRSTLVTLTKAHYLKKKQWVVWENYTPALLERGGSL